MLKPLILFSFLKGNILPFTRFLNIYLGGNKKIRNCLFNACVTINLLLRTTDVQVLVL